MLSKTSAVTFPAIRPLFFSVATVDLKEYTNPDWKTVWDEAPYFSKDEIKSYPDLKGPNGEDLTIENLRGVHLFGWKGWSGEKGDTIGNDGKGDPDNKCGDKAYQPPQCSPRNPGTPVDDEDKRLEAYSEPNEKYSRITFCSKFFDLPTLTEAIDRTKKKSTIDHNNLEFWNNRARCFFHEVTHLDYFMNADDNNDNSKSPEVFDTQFKYKSDKITPFGPPRKSLNGDPLFAEDTDPDAVGETADDSLIGGDENDDHAPGFHVPGSGNKYDTPKGTAKEPPNETPKEVP
ncbi:MAG: hypothetical protein Q9164_007212, partial [Protoblastenia rupestris]